MYRSKTGRQLNQQLSGSDRKKRFLRASVIAPIIALLVLFGMPAVSFADTDSGGSSGETAEQEYVLNRNTRKFHRPECPSVTHIKEKNRGTFTGSRDELIGQGYEPCQNCNP